MRTTIICIVAVILAFFVIQCGDNTSLREGKLLYSQGKYAQALAKYDQQLTKTPRGRLAKQANLEIRKLYKEWIEAELKFQRFESVLTLMKDLVKRYPDSEEAKWVQGQQSQTEYKADMEMMQKGFVPEASKRMKEFIKTYPDDPNIGAIRESLDGIGIIAFVKDGNIWLSMADGSDPRMVVKNGIYPDLSHDGKNIAFIRPNKPGDTVGQLYYCTIEGKNETQLLKSPIAFRPRWSANGIRVAVSKENFFQFVDMESEEAKTIRPEELGYAGIFDSFGDWSSDLKILICYSKEPGEDGLFQVCRVDSDLSKAFKLSDSKSPIRDVSFSYDDTSIGVSDGEGLYILDPQGLNKTTLVDKAKHELDVYSIAFSPSGKSIFFIAKDKSGKFFPYIIGRGDIGLKGTLILPVFISGAEEGWETQPLGCSWTVGKLGPAQ